MFFETLRVHSLLRYRELGWIHDKYTDVKYIEEINENVVYLVLLCFIDSVAWTMNIFMLLLVKHWHNKKHSQL